MDFAKVQINRAVQDAVAKITEMHKTEHDEKAFEEDLYSTLQTLLNNVHLAQSIAFSSLLTNVKAKPEPPPPVIKYQSTYASSLATASFDSLKYDEYPNTSKYIYKPPEENESRAIKTYEPKQNFQWQYTSDLEQCCARIGNEKIFIQEQIPEFLDKYPYGTYQDENGNVYGHPCRRTIDADEFIVGRIFCEAHNIGYSDIRVKPSLYSTSDKTEDIDFSEYIDFM